MRVSIKPVTLREAMKHQNKYISWGMNKIHFACLMEMRLGKTLANIRLVREWCAFDKVWEGTESFPCLVVCPAAVIETWERELREEGEFCVVIQGKTFDKRTEIAVNSAFSGKGRVWVLINYESLLYTPGLTLLPWYFVGLDESPIIKNPKSKISQLCTGEHNFEDVRHRAILTGLPCPESELDLFQQFYFLYREFMGCVNYWEFRNKYFELTWKGYEPKPGLKSKIQSYTHRRSFVLTRNQAGIGSKKIREFRYCEMTKEQIKVYDKAELEFIGLISNGKFEEDTERETDHVIVQRTWLARIAGGCDPLGNFKWNPKVKELLNLLKGELANQPVVVWFRFDAEIKAVAQILRKAGINLQTLTGDDNRVAKKNKQEWFRTSRIAGRVMLCQAMKVAEYGVDMSSASVAINYSYVYSAHTIAQDDDRIVNPKKDDVLLYIYLVSRGSIDEDAVEAIRDKVRNAKMFMSKMQFNFRKRIEKKYGNTTDRTRSSRTR